MRSITTKLILAFLFVSLISIGTIVVLTRFSANREFTKFISNQYEAELVEELEGYYAKSTSWDGINEAAIGHMQNQFGPENDRPSNFCIADLNGLIIRESFTHKLGDMVPPDVLETSLAITVDEKTVGYLLIDKPPDRRDPMETEFVRRLDSSLLLTAVGTIILAFIFGAVISRTITKPIRELTNATHAMAAGKLGQKVAVRSKDEIGELAQSFNKMNDELAHSFNLRKQMTADIAHELRTPLSLIIGHAEAVNDGVLPPTHENFEIIREEAERLEKLVTDLRTLSLADAGELPLDFQSVDINKLLNDTKTHYMVQLNQKRITLDLEPASDILKVNLDPVRFSQVLMNILDNALRYTPEDGRISISTKQSKHEVEITIQDSGEGVTPEEASHLFDRFYRADESRTRDDGGSGLGLAIAKSIVEMHKGVIWAESEKGKGLRTIIQLPIA
ncbi:MAG: HAMP domain-containing protein [Anaerolineales bacterium]|nr:HAMP domain-containing protein [Anaerolineales bacterium]